MPKGKGPTPAELREAREKAGLTQAEAAALVHALERSWRHWESGRSGMSAGLWELFQLKAGRQVRA